jgi:hypothetical protein
LETKFRPNLNFFVFWRPLWIQNGHHSKPTMEINSYKNPPIWEKFGFQVDYDVANWYSSLVCYGIWRPFCTLVTMATAAILNFFNPPKAATHYSGYSYKVSWSLMKGIEKFVKSPLFSFHGNCGKVCPTYNCLGLWSAI